MSVVWLGHDQVLGRPVAVKMLTAHYLAHPSVRHRILTEAQAAARLSHPRITSVYDYGEAMTESGERLPYVVMELLSGPTLAERLRDGALPVRAALHVCVQVASALATAHDRGVVHRDVKPANVMLTPTGVKVLDFGLAAAVGEHSDDDVLGTPAYLAPERLTTGEAVPASDVYGLGLLLYTALTGRMPWRAETVSEMLAAHRYTEPAPLPPIAGLPPVVAALCQRCLAKDPDARPTAYEVALELAEVGGWRVTAGWTASPPAAAGPPSLPRPAGPVPLPLGTATLPVPGEPAHVGAAVWRTSALAGAMVAVLVAVLGGFWVTGEDPGLPATPAPALAAPEPWGPPAANTPPLTPDGEEIAPEDEPEDPSPTDDSAGRGGEAGGAADRAPAPESDPSTGDSGSDPGSSDPGSDPSDPGSSSGSPGSDSSEDPDPGSNPDSDPDSDPDPDPTESPTPETVEASVSTGAGQLVVQCTGSTATLVSSSLLPGFSVVDGGPGPEIRIGLLGVVGVVVRCGSAGPVVALDL